MAALGAGAPARQAAPAPAAPAHPRDEHCPHRRAARGLRRDPVRDLMSRRRLVSLRTLRTFWDLRNLRALHASGLEGDPGAQPQRTVLSWQRTVLAAALRWRVAPRVRRDQPAHRHGRRGGALRARHLGGDPRNDQVNLALNTLASRALLWHRGASTFLTELESREFPAVTPEPLFPRLGRVRL